MVVAADCSFDVFVASFKSIRFEKRRQFGGRMSRTMSCGFDYYMYIDINTLQPINPYTKKDKGKKVLKTLVSTSNIDDVKRKMFVFILETALSLGLFDECVCDTLLKEKQASTLIKK